MINQEVKGVGVWPLMRNGVRFNHEFKAPTSHGSSGYYTVGASMENCMGCFVARWLVVTAGSNKALAVEEVVAELIGACVRQPATRDFAATYRYRNLAYRARVPLGLGRCRHSASEVSEALPHLGQLPLAS